MTYDDTAHEPTGPVEDDRLRLIFTCCHPALAPEARIALTLRLLGGLTVAEVAQAFLVPETTMAQRITRAKKKIAAANVPYRVPEAADLPKRLGTVLAVLFLVFNEGYLASGDGDPVRTELTREAIRLTRVLRGLLPDEPEVTGLLAMMLLIEARREARVRERPARPARRAGPRRLGPGARRQGSCPRARVPGDQPARPLPAARSVNAVHTDAPTAADTDWSQVVALYDQLVRLDPVTHRRSQPRGRRRRARRPLSRPGAGGPPPAPELPPVARRASRPAPPARPQHRGPGRVWRCPRWDPELR